MSRESRFTAGVLLLLTPTAVYGGAGVLSPLFGGAEYADNQLRAVKRLAVGRGKIGHLKIDELEVGKLRVRELAVEEKG